ELDLPVRVGVDHRGVALGDEQPHLRGGDQRAGVGRVGAPQWGDGAVDLGEPRVIHGALRANVPGERAELDGAAGRAALVEQAVADPAGRGIDGAFGVVIAGGFGATARSADLDDLTALVRDGLGRQELVVERDTVWVVRERDLAVRPCQPGVRVAPQLAIAVEVRGGEVIGATSRAGRRRLIAALL